MQQRICRGRRGCRCHLFRGCSHSVASGHASLVCRSTLLQSGSNWMGRLNWITQHDFCIVCSSVYICLKYVNLSIRGKRKQVPHRSSIVNIATSAITSEFFSCYCSLITHATVWDYKGNQKAVLGALPKLSLVGCTIEPKCRLDEPREISVHMKSTLPFFQIEQIVFYRESAGNVGQVWSQTLPRLIPLTLT